MPTPRSARITTAVVGVLVAGAIAGTAAATLPATAGSTAPSPSASAPAGTPTPTDAPSPVPTPQATTVAPLESAAPIRTDLVAEVTAMQAVEGKAAQPGEVAGPAVRFTITLRNATDKAFDLSNTVVNAVSGEDDDPAYPLTQPGGKPFPTSVAAGATVTGVYVFAMPTDERKDVTVTLDTSTDTPVVAFTGDAPQ